MEPSSTLCNDVAQKSPIRGLLWAQFIEAFTDNAWKLIIFTLATRSIVSGDINRASQFTATLSLLCFLLPMFLFSLPSSLLADRFSKRSIIVAMKVVGVVLMTIAAASLFFAPTSLLMPFILLSFMGVQSAIFSPAKYGILPELLPREKLAAGNGLLEMSTMIAIISGTGLGPVLLFADDGGARPWLTCTGPIVLAILAVFALLWSLTIPYVPPARTTPIGALESTKETWKALRKDRILWLALMGSMIYWMILSLIGQDVLVYAKKLVLELEKGEMWQGIPPASFGIGIAIGAVLAGKLFGERIEFGLIPLGTFGFALMSFLLGYFQPGMEFSVIILLLMGIFTGLLVVPLHALIQLRAPSDKRGAIIAIGNLFDIAGMVAGSFLASLMAMAGFQLGVILMASAFIVLLATLWALYLLPDAFVRLNFLIYARFFYKVDIIGEEHIPSGKSLLLISPTLTCSDVLLAAVVLGKKMRLLVHESFFDKWWKKIFGRALGAISISPSTSKEHLLKQFVKTRGGIEEQILLILLPLDDQAKSLVCKNIQIISEKYPVKIVNTLVEREKYSLFHLLSFRRHNALPTAKVTFQYTQFPFG